MLLVMNHWAGPEHRSKNNINVSLQFADTMTRCMVAFDNLK